MDLSKMLDSKNLQILFFFQCQKKTGRNRYANRDNYYNFSIAIFKRNRCHSVLALIANEKLI